MKAIKKQSMVKVKYQAAVNQGTLGVVIQPIKEQTMSKVKHQAAGNGIFCL